MKKFLLTILSIVFFNICLFSAGTLQSDGPITINVKVGDGGYEGPRMPALIPIQGLVHSDTIYLSFSFDLGDVDVILEEATSGTVLHTVVDASSLYATIPFSGDAGDYTITFTLENGAEYVGSFLL
ncbi:MAG: DUF3244 domain-containing protein [Bacteroidales bacterium]|nr:DUF3244 domain-containing protein [Bacteroidales bacterium]